MDSTKIKTVYSTKDTNEKQATGIFTEHISDRKLV